MEIIDAVSLSTRVALFYCEARPKEKDPNSHEPLCLEHTLLNIRAAIKRHLANLKRNLGIVKDKGF
jgi:hypothetical protein